MHDIRLCVQYANTRSPTFDGNVFSICIFGGLQLYQHTNTDFSFFLGIAFKTRIRWKKALKGSEKNMCCSNWRSVRNGWKCRDKKQSQFFNFHLSCPTIPLDILQIDFLSHRLSHTHSLFVGLQILNLIFVFHFPFCEAIKFINVNIVSLFVL